MTPEDIWQFEGGFALRHKSVFGNFKNLRVTDILFLDKLSPLITN